MASLQMLAPVHGRIQPLARHPSRWFASGVLGDGISITCHGHDVVAPVSGELVEVNVAGTLFTIATANLIVQLGFSAEVVTGAERAIELTSRIARQVTPRQPISAGSLLCRLRLPELTQCFGHRELAVMVYAKQHATRLSEQVLRVQPLQARQGETLQWDWQSVTTSSSTRVKEPR